MTMRTITSTTIAFTLAGAALFGSAGSASAQTRGLPLSDGRAPTATAEICSDWTNEDGTHGTNCPKGGGGGGGRFDRWIDIYSWS